MGRAAFPIHVPSWTCLLYNCSFLTCTQMQSSCISSLFLRMCTFERDFQAVCGVRRSQCSSSLYPAQNSQPENCVSDVMPWLPKSPRCSFFSHSIGLAWLTSQLSPLFTCKNQMLTQPHPSPLSLSFSIHGKKIPSLCFSFRVTSKMSTKTLSQLLLKTSKFALLASPMSFKINRSDAGKWSCRN